MKLNLASLQDRAGWAAAGVALPQYDVEQVVARTRANPMWVHFGAGNIFRGFIGSLAQRMLNAGVCDRGIIAAETFDYGIISDIYDPFDNLTLNVTLNADGSFDREIQAGIVEGIAVDSANPANMARMKEIFTNPGLQMISFTITEKGYALRRVDGSLMPVVVADMEEGPSAARHAMSIVCALLLERYKAGRYPLAVVSMDNCSHNGEKLQASVLEIAKAWLDKGYVEQGFMDYLTDEKTIAFPWSMIDKITPRPAPAVEKALEEAGIEDIAPVKTAKGTFIAPFVNAERPQYLVIEDTFPNGRPPLEKAGVYFGTRATVNKSETMKVTTCLNPLHTALAVYGCLLGYTLICDEMKDGELVNLVKRLGYQEGLPVVVDPEILSPRAFIDEVVNERLPNPYMPDTPQRIATDTSQKVAIRYGETIKSYRSGGEDLNQLVAIPLAIAGWLRYLLAVDDNGAPMEVSADPMKADLQTMLVGVELGNPESVTGKLQPILSNAAIFGSDLTETPLAAKIEGYLKEELVGPGAVRATLHKYVG
ncbi:MAG: mannitol dehydrogenase family protein [Clostridiales bacterium]|nr:mannitol dehydrogenase family protein [Clostridiales bacterium]